MGLDEKIANRGLWHSIFIGADSAAVEAAEEILKLMDLPEPVQGAFFPAFNSTRVFMPQGIVISFIYDTSNIIDHAAKKLGLIKQVSPIFAAAAYQGEELNQPIVSEQISRKCRMEITAGVAGITTGADAYVKEFTKILKAKGLKVLSEQPEIIGVIPDAGDENPLVVIRNRRAVGLKAEELPKDQAPRQTRIFGPLGEQFREAIKSHNPLLMKIALEDCERIVALPKGDPNRILVPYWLEDEPTPTVRLQDIQGAGLLYRQQLRAFDNHSPA